MRDFKILRFARLLSLQSRLKNQSVCITIIFTFSIFLALLSCPVAFAATTVSGEIINNSYLASEVVFDVTQAGQIAVDGRNLKSAEINLTIPQDDENQDVTRYNISPSDIVLDKLGNQLLKITQSNPANPITYTTKAQVVVRQKQVFSLPQSYTIPADIQIFLKSTEHIQADAAEIKNLAASITKDETTDFEKVAALALWVNPYLTYDVSLAGQNKDSLWVLQNKKGVCAEYSTLFTALSRAAGIPARYTSVYAYGDNGWESHAISEVWLGKWIAVDPLWLQVGRVDATHVKYTSQEDNQVMNSISVLGEKVESISWQADDYNFDTKSVTYAEKSKNYTLSISSQKLEPGDEFVVFADFSSPEYFVEEFTFEPCISQTIGASIATFDEKKVQEVFSPEKSKLVIWKGKVNAGLQSGYVYTCPLVLNSRYWENGQLNLTISKSGEEYESAAELEVRLAKSVLKMGETQTIYVSAKRTRGDGAISIGALSSAASFSEEKSLDLNKNEEGAVAFELTPASAGLIDVVVYSSSGEIDNTSFEVEAAPGDVFIKSISMPQNATKGENITANITILNNKTEPLELRLQIGDYIETFFLKQQAEKTVEYKVNTSRAGLQGITVKLTGAGIADERYAEIFIISSKEENFLVRIFSRIADFFSSVFATIRAALRV